MTIQTDERIIFNYYFSMTINKSQDQSLNNIELYLPKNVSSHRLYIIIFRVKTRESFKIMTHDKNKHINLLQLLLFSKKNFTTFHKDTFKYILIYPLFPFFF